MIYDVQRAEYNDHIVEQLNMVDENYEYFTWEKIIQLVKVKRLNKMIQTSEWIDSDVWMPDSDVLKK